MATERPSNDPRIEAALDAVAAASEVTRAVQADLAAAGVLEKADLSPVTVADYAAQAIVAHVLEARLGPVRLVAEERADALREGAQAALLEETVARARAQWADVTPDALMDAIDRGAQEPSPEGFWTLDPVDGTKGFLRNAHYAVSLAWVEGGAPTLGVLGCPNFSRDSTRDLAEPGQGVLAVAERGRGVWQASLRARDEWAPLKAAPRAVDAVRICESVEKRHSNFDAHADILEAAGLVGASIRIDSQAKYLVVARNQADIYLRLPSQRGYVEKIWDHAAGALVAEQAGLRVTDFSGRALDFSKGRRLEDNRGVVVAAPEHHARLIGAIRERGYAAEV